MGDEKSHLKGMSLRSAVYIAAIYFTLSFLWILFSDIIISRVTSDPELLSLLQTWKGLTFVSVTALLLFYLINMRNKALISAKMQEHRTALFNARLLKAIPDFVFTMNESTSAIRIHSKGTIPWKYGWNMDDELSPRDLFNDSTVDSMHALAKKALQGQKIVESTLAMEVKDGSVWMHVCASTLKRSPEGESDRIILFIARDITSLIKQRKQLNQAEDELKKRIDSISSMNRDLAAFDYSVSNALKVPIRHIEGYTTLLRQDVSDQIFDTTEEYVEKIQKAATSARKLLRELLQLSRASQSPVAEEGIDISLLARSIAARLNKQQGNSTVSFQVEQNLVAQASYNLMETLLNNLLDNAWKYTSDVPDPQVRVYRVQEDRKHFVVEDNGIGLKDEDPDALLEPFVVGSNGHRFAGNGLGLATARRIVERHGGDLWLEDGPMGGCAAHFTLNTDT